VISLILNPNAHFQLFFLGEVLWRVAIGSDAGIDDGHSMLSDERWAINVGHWMAIETAIECKPALDIYPSSSLL